MSAIADLGEIERARRAGLDRFSFTAMSLADACLLAYAGRYGNGKRFAPVAAAVASEALERGRVLHAIIRLYIDYLDANELVEDRYMMPTFIERAWREDAETHSTESWEDVWIGASGFASWYRHVPERSLGGEFRLERVLHIPGESDALIVGYPDTGELFEDDLVLFTDWKTGWDAAVSDLNRFQGETACWMAMDEHGSFAGKRFGYRVGWPRAKRYSEIYELLERDVYRLEARMRTIVSLVRAARRANRFPARPGRHCTICSLAATCAANLDLRELDVHVGSPKDAQRALGEITLLDAARKSRVKALQQFVDANGPVRENGMIADYAYKETLEIDGVQRLLQRAGLLPAPLPDPVPPTLRFWLDLLAVNGRKTTTKKAQNDERLVGLWRPKYKTVWELRKEGVTDDASAEEGEVPSAAGAGADDDPD